jgi:single-stranded DNA-binding protein
LTSGQAGRGEKRPTRFALSLTKGSRVLVSGRLEQRSWETDGGERRSKVEIVADDVAASLRFATTDVHRVHRTVADDDQNAEASRPGARGPEQTKEKESHGRHHPSAPVYSPDEAPQPEGPEAGSCATGNLPHICA